MAAEASAEAGAAAPMAAEASAAEATAAEASAEVDAAVHMAAEAGPSAAAEALAEVVHAVVEASAEEATAVVDGAWAEDVPSADTDNESNIILSKYFPCTQKLFRVQGKYFLCAVQKYIVYLAKSNLLLPREVTARQKNTKKFGLSHDFS